MNIEMIKAAGQRLAGFARHTPLLSSPFLDDIAGRRILLKAECLQQTGSFKFRGGWSAISALSAQDRARGVIAYSSGNHAQGLANAAREHGVRSVILMPGDAPVLKVENTRALGAEVVLYDRATQDRDALGETLAQERGLILIKPFDNPQVIAGQGTTGLEIATQVAELGADAGDVLIPCGGGGLTSGIALALAANAPGLRARPVEPAGFDDVTRSQQSGQIEKNAATTGSICDAILTRSPGQITFPIIKQFCGPGIVVPDEDCLRAMAAAFSRLKIVLEPGGAIALAAALYHPDQMKADTVVVVASGGNVDAGIFAGAIETYGTGE